MFGSAVNGLVLNTSATIAGIAYGVGAAVAVAGVTVPLLVNSLSIAALPMPLVRPAVWLGYAVYGVGLGFGSMPMSQPRCGPRRSKPLGRRPVNASNSRTATAVLGDERSVVLENNTPAGRRIWAVRCCVPLRGSTASEVQFELFVLCDRVEHNGGV